mmetsp:Transcript_6851/g.8353  ORF Transcript_6851/g.8353 Transcript_6851/m.8353 type:complete len:197 (-) Transcript_6851:4123-4713(-)
MRLFYPIENYKFYTSKAVKRKDRKMRHKLQRLKYKFLKFGSFASRKSIVIVTKHKHPYVLLFRSFNDKFDIIDIDKLLKFKSDHLKKVNLENVNNVSKNLFTKSMNSRLVSIFLRQGFESKLYPYCLPHIKYTKQIFFVYLNFLKKNELFQIPKNFEVKAFPFFEIYLNNYYGAIINSIPTMVSKYYKLKNKKPQT